MLWWEGPPFLQHTDDNWPKDISDKPTDVNIELNKSAQSITLMTVMETDVLCCEDFSSFTRLLRVCAWIKRF